MKKILKRASLAFSTFAITLISVVGLSARVLAYDPLFDACQAGEGDASSVCQERSSYVDPTDKANGIIPKVANIIAAAGGLIAVIFIMVNGITIMTSTGDSAKINKARDGLIYAAVGIAVIVMARLIVALILRFV